MEYDLNRNKETLGNNAQGEIRNNIATDAALRIPEKQQSERMYSI